MTMQPAPKKTAEMEAIEKLETSMNANFAHIGNQLVRVSSRQNAQHLVLRARVKRAEDDIGKMGEVVTKHEQKINLAIGGAAVLSAVGAWVGWAAKQLYAATLGKLHNG